MNRFFNKREIGGVVVKKRVVAIMLSLTMCLSMTAEASAASEADFYS